MFENAKQPDDMFDGIETPAPPSAPAAAATSAVPPLREVSAPRGRSAWKIALAAAVTLAAVGAAGTLAYVLLASREPVLPVPPKDDVVSAGETPEEPAAPVSDETQRPPAAASEPSAAPSDRDRDGTSDADEAALGTSPTSSDTDADGLFDTEEVKTFGTDPLNPDSDGDGFQDGAEVKNGYNPAGPGKLFKVPQP